MIDAEYQPAFLGGPDNNNVGPVLTKYLKGVSRDQSRKFCRINNLVNVLLEKVPSLSKLNKNGKAIQMINDGMNSTRQQSGSSSEQLITPSQFYVNDTITSAEALILNETPTQTHARLLTYQLSYSLLNKQFTLSQNQYFQSPSQLIK